MFKFIYIYYCIQSFSKLIIKDSFGNVHQITASIEKNSIDLPYVLEAFDPTFPGNIFKIKRINTGFYNFIPLKISWKWSKSKS
jgi:hypothetical protein